MAENDRDKFDILTGALRYWTVAAIHGEVDRLVALHDQLDSRFRRGDRLIYLGNVIGRGRRIIETIDELLLFRRLLLARYLLVPGDIVFLRGSQEEMWQKLLQLHIAPNPAQVLEWMLAHGVEATLAAYGGNGDQVRMRCREGALALARWTGELRRAIHARPGHEQFLSNLRRAAYSADGRMLFVHAGIDIARPLSAQNDSFWWGAPGFAAIDEPYDGFVRIVRGFDPAAGGFAVGKISATIDSGCGRGGALTAACFDADGELVERLEV